MYDSSQYAFRDLQVMLLGRVLTGFQGIKYKVSVEKERVFGRGNKALAIQTGNETIEGTLKLLQSELDALQAAAKAVNPLNKVTDIAFDLVVTYGDGNTAKTDRIFSAQFTEYEKGMEQNDKFMLIELPFIALGVQHGY